MTIRVFEAFSGYGSQSIALRNINVPHEVVAISEINKYAITAYRAIHDESDVVNLGDISLIDVENVPDHDLFTYSFPCQDLSIAGKQVGLEGARSGLLYECKKIIEHCRPKYLLLENVKNLVSKKFKPKFDEWLEYLESLGYTNYWKVLNAKDYGIPQNRERVFVVSILGEHTPYEFPDPIPLDLCIADMLEHEVESKYYMDKPFHLVNKGHQAELDMKGHDSMKRVYATDRIAPTLTTMGGGNTEPKILERKEMIIDDTQGFDGVRYYENYSPTLRAGRSGLKTVEYDDTDPNSFRVRKLTPRECFRLMGVSDEDIDKIQATGLSNSQQYRMAGNSIVVDVLEAIFRNLFEEEIL